MEDDISNEIIGLLFLNGSNNIFLLLCLDFIGICRKIVRVPKKIFEIYNKMIENYCCPSRPRSQKIMGKNSPSH